MKKFAILLGFASLLSASAIEQIDPLKDFGPPAVLKPFDRAFIENQFELSHRDYLDDELLKNASFTSALFQNSTYNSFLFRHKDAKFYNIFKLTNIKANSYKDGANNRVDFGYKRLGINAVAGFTPNEFSDTKIAFIRDDLQDDLQPQFNMDPVKTTRNIYMLNQRIGDANLSNSVNINLKYIDLKRQANNYKFRAAPALMRMQIDRKIFNPSISYDVDLDDFHFQFGFDYSKDKHIAKRYANDVLNAYKFPDIRQNEYEIYAKNRYKINEENSLDFELAYQANKARANKQNERLINPSKMPAPFFSTANNLWQKYYQKSFDSIKHDAFNLKLAYDYQDELSGFNVAFLRVARMPSNNERFAAIASPKGAQVSNPFIKAEQHNIIRLQASSKNTAYKGYLNSLFENGYELSALFSFDKVNDLIVYEKSASGVLLSKNVDANILKLELDAKYNFAQHYAASIKLSYARGQNTSDSTPLYQIRPLEINSRIDYKNYFSHGSYQIGLAHRYSFRQNRINQLIDKDLGGFGVLDLFSNIKLKDSFSISFGVSNLLNKHYAEFISPSHVENFDYDLISAPKRTFFVKFNTTF